MTPMSLSSAAVHVNFMCRSMDLVAYEAYNCTTTPRAVPVYDTAQTPGPAPEFSVTRLLRTAGVDAYLAGRREARLLRCHQYDFRGCCDRGASCRYVHVISIDGSLDRPRRRHRLPQPFSTPRRSSARIRLATNDEVRDTEGVTAAAPTPPPTAPPPPTPHRTAATDHHRRRYHHNPYEVVSRPSLQEPDNNDVLNRTSQGPV